MILPDGRQGKLACGGGYTCQMNDHEGLQADVIRRLRRIEGQVRGLQRLVEEDAPCRDVISQFKAARTALDSAGKLLLAQFLARSIISGDGKVDNDTLDTFLHF